MLLPDFAHGLGISLVEWSAIIRRWIGVTLAERLDQSALDRRRVPGMLSRKGELFPGELGGGRRHGGIINMRPGGERDSPVRHGAFGIESRGLLEGTNGGAVIEAVKERKALVKIALRFG